MERLIEEARNLAALLLGQAHGMWQTLSLGAAEVTAQSATPATPVTMIGKSAVHNLDFSIIAMFLRADVVVQAVVLLLALASFWSWTVIFEKALHIRRVNARSSKFEDAFWSGGSLDDLFDKMDNRPRDPMGAMFNAAMREWQRSPRRNGTKSEGARVNLQQRIERVMHVTFGREMDRLERYLSYLASVGAVAPFVGLFGTVWGITNSFQSIALTKNTSLTAVAPGIAEALFATALGLVAAIPAVVAYNKLSTDLGRYANRLDAFASEFSAILSRQLEEGSG